MCCPWHMGCLAGIHTGNTGLWGSVSHADIELLCRNPHSSMVKWGLMVYALAGGHIIGDKKNF